MATPLWAEAGHPCLLSASNDAQGHTFLTGLSPNGDVLFSQPVPGRGHAAAAHPFRAEAVAFSRRPGRFAVVLECLTGQVMARLNAPAARHFYGHGAYSANGRLLFTTENAFEGPDGRIGVWDVAKGYARIGDLPSGGIGPHEMIRLPDGGFAVANGGIQTHPDYARAKLNLPDMRPNLSYLSADGALLDQVAPPAAMHQNSIRHIAADAGGRVFIALQWQGNPLEQVPLVAMHQRGQDLTFLPHPDTARLKQYAGSIAISGDGAEVGVTGPKGGYVTFFDAVSGAAKKGADLKEASGIAPFGAGFVMTVSGGLATGNSTAQTQLPVSKDMVWDNHLVGL